MAANPSAAASTTPSPQSEPPQSQPQQCQVIDQCACSNISIMQLFHELKQEFPKLPDHIVSQCIQTHCHDRPQCTAELQEAANNMTQISYPAQSLRKAPAPPSASAPVSRRCSSDSAKLKTVADSAPIKCDNNNEVISDNNEVKAQRPNTLNLAPVSGADSAGAIPKRPVRPAPLPPTPPTSTSQVTQTPSSNDEVSLNVNVNCSMGLVSPLRPPRHTSALNVQPEPVWARDIQSPRSFTSVNLTLRTPTSTPQSPIDIQTGPSLSYSTSSYDARQGFQSRLQITVGPGGAGCVSAVRTRPKSTYVEGSERVAPDLGGVTRAESMPNVTTAVTPEETNTIQRQLLRKQRLEVELLAERTRLLAMQGQVLALEGRGVAQGPATVLRLRRDIQTLQVQCEQMAQRVDRFPPVPLGETSEEFYRNIYTGQQMVRPLRRAPPRPPPPRINPEGPPWTCHLCTFRNYPLLDQCEQCDMPRILLGTVTHTPLHSMNKLETVSLLRSDSGYENSNSNDNNSMFNNLSGTLDTVVSPINTSMANMKTVSS